MELTLESALSLGGLLGNLSYILLIASMSMRNMLWLRGLVILSGLTGVSYDFFWLHDPVGTFWESGFTLINFGHWSWLLWDRRRKRRRLDYNRPTTRNNEIITVGTSRNRYRNPRSAHFSSVFPHDCR